MVNEAISHCSTLKQGQENFNYNLSQENFNYNLSHARIGVENANGRLKARWRRLCESSDMIVENVPTVITACCILHNVCEVYCDRFNERWIEEHSNLLEQSLNHYCYK